jgi:hypothetical protein
LLLRIKAQWGVSRRPTEVIMPDRSHGTSNKDQNDMDRDERGKSTEESSSRGTTNRGQTGTERDDRGRFTEEGSDRETTSGSKTASRGTTRKK